MLKNSIVIGNTYKISDKKDADNSYHHFAENQLVRVSNFDKWSDNYVRCENINNYKDIQYILFSDLKELI